MSEFKQAERTPRPNYGKYVFVLLLMFVGCVGSAGYFIFGGGDSETTNQTSTEQPDDNKTSSTGGSTSGSTSGDW